VAVGHKGAHLAFVGQGLPVVLFGFVDIWGLAICVDLAEEAEGPRFISLLLVVVKEIEGGGQIEAVCIVTTRSRGNWLRSNI